MKIFLTLVVLAVLAVYVPPMLVNTAALRDAIGAQVRAATGHELTVKGAVSLHLLPSPSLTLGKVELDTGKQPGQPQLHADSMTVHLGFDSLLSGKPQAEGVTLVSPVLNIERGPDGQVRWGWLAGPGVSHGLPALSVQGGRLVFSDGDEHNVRLEDITLSLAQDAQLGLHASGQMRYRDKPLRVNLTLPPRMAGQGTRMELHLWQSDATMLSATLERTGENAWHGDLQAQAADIMQWLSAPAATTTTPPTPYPLKLAGKLDYANDTLTVTNILLESADSAGKGEAAFALGTNLAANVRLNFNRLKIRPALLAQYLNGTAAAAASQDVPSPVDIAESGTRLPENITMAFQIGAESLFVDAQQFSGVMLTGSLQNGELAINSLQGSGAGDSAIALSGRLMDTAKGLRFEGRTETTGKDLRGVLATIDPAAARLPAKGFGEFHLAANVFLSSDQLRLSEAEFRTGDLRLNGGLVTYFEAQPRVEADIALSDINLDYFRDTWRESLQHGADKDFTYKINSSVDFSWLKNLRAIVDLKVNLQRFTFLEQPGDSASFQLYARQNEIGLRDISMHYPDGELKGSAVVTVNGQTPNLAIDVQVPQLDTAYFSATGQPGKPWINPASPDERWSRDLLDFGWMVGLTARVKAGVGRLVHRGENYDRFLLAGDLAGEQFRISALSFEHFGGKVDATGNLSGGKVPGFSGNFTIYNADLKPLLQGAVPGDTLSGRVSIGGAVVTSGISFEEWVKQADVKLSVVGRGVRAERFNLQGVADATLASRSVADVVANINRTLPVASTDFSVDGTININGGIMRTPGLVLVAGQAVGLLTGEVRLLPWKMAMSSVFQMKMLDSNTVPVLTVDISGTPDDYAMKLDTSSLEAFVAKRIVGN